MKIVKIVILTVAALALGLSFAFAAGDAEKGKASFNDPKFAGGKQACSSCHPNGKLLENTADKKEFKTPAGATKTLEEAINVCIVNANKGKALDPKSADMANIVAYIKSLKAKAPAAEKEKAKPKKKSVEGC